MVHPSPVDCVGEFTYPRNSEVLVKIRNGECIRNHDLKFYKIYNYISKYAILTSIIVGKSHDLLATGADVMLM